MSANTAQSAPEREQSLDDNTTRQSSENSTIETTETITDTATLPNGHDAARGTMDESQRNAHSDNAVTANENADDDRPAPFPPYREPEDEEELETIRNVVHDPLGISVQENPALLRSTGGSAPQPQDRDTLQSEPIAEAASETTSEPTSDSLSTPTQPAEQTPEVAAETTATAATEPEPFAQPKPPSPVSSPPAPPPWWTHSRDGSQSNNTLNTDVGRPATAAASTSRTNTATSFFSAPFLRRLDSSSRSHGTSSSGASSSTQRPSTGTTHTSSSKPKNGQPYYQGHHRRDTSSSTLDLNANLITLQDNEAEEGDGGYDSYGGGSGWQYNGAPTDTIVTPTSPSTLLSPTNSSLLSPGAPPGSAGSSNTSHASRAGNTSPLTASATSPTLSTTTRTTSNIHKTNSNYNRCWARRVDITDHVVIGAGNSGGSGGGLFSGFSSSNSQPHPKLGAFVVWTIRVQTLDGGTSTTASNGTPAPHSFSIYKRYSEFDTLRRKLVASFPQARGGGALPPLPPKSVLGKFKPAFLEQRRLGLQYFLNCILLNPEFAGSPVLQEFLFS